MQGVRRLVHSDAGQAMAEYGIALAMAAGIRWVQRLPQLFADDPWRVTAVVVGFVIVTAWVSRPAR
jgi:hypothetical protein